MANRQIIVLLVEMTSDESMEKAIEIAKGFQGVESIDIEGSDRMVLVGVDVDASSLTLALRKKVGEAWIASVKKMEDGYGYGYGYGGNSGYRGYSGNSSFATNSRKPTYGYGYSMSQNSVRITRPSSGNAMTRNTQRTNQPLSNYNTRRTAQPLSNYTGRNTYHPSGNTMAQKPQRNTNRPSGNTVARNTERNTRPPPGNTVAPLSTNAARTWYT